MITIALTLFGLYGVAAWIIFRTMGRNSAIVFLYGPPFCAVVGPGIWIIPALPLMLLSSKGFAAGAAWAFFVFLVGTVPAFVAGMVYSATLLYFIQGTSYAQSRTRLLAAVSGAFLGCVAAAILLRSLGMALFGTVSGATSGAIFFGIASRRLAKDR